VCYDLPNAWGEHAVTGAAHILEVAIERKAEADRDRLNAAFDALGKFDPSLRVMTGTDSGQWVIAGHSEEHLNGAIDILVNCFHIEVNVSAPQVAYLETLSRAATVKYAHKKHLGGMGQFAEVMIVFKPLPRGSGFVFQNEVASGAIPKEFIPAIENGLRKQAESGLLAGFPVIDFKACLVDGKYHEVDSNPLTFDIAARAAFRELHARDVAILLEPIMKVIVLTPDDFLGGVVGDLNSRKGTVLDTTEAGPFQLVEALVPLSSMFGYAATLESMTQGQARFSMTFEKYEQAPKFLGGDDTFPQATAMRA